jgi:peptidoglycan hydrolase-like protein with peptidoglycan-binding domain
MARSAKRPKKPAHLMLARNGAVALGGVVSRNPVLVGGTTAFLVALTFVSANALWYQPHFHSGAFFSTRDQGSSYVAPEFGNGIALGEDEAETTIKIERPQYLPQPKPDPVVEQVQGILRDLDFYGGTVDGITGPATRTAIANYRKKVGLPASEAIDDELLTQLGARQTTAAIAVTPAPAPREREGKQAAASPDATPPASDPLILKIQAGLKAFGNDGMEVDGVMGAKTKNAIREFQSLFGLPVTGEPDQVVYAKMREIGLTN